MCLIFFHKASLLEMVIKCFDSSSCECHHIVLASGKPKNWLKRRVMELEEDPLRRTRNGVQT
jgi:hypothetical protein